MQIKTKNTIIKAVSALCIGLLQSGCSREDPGFVGVYNGNQAVLVANKLQTALTPFIIPFAIAGIMICAIQMFFFPNDETLTRIRQNIVYILLAIVLFYGLPSLFKGIKVLIDSAVG